MLEERDMAKNSSICNYRAHMSLPFFPNESPVPLPESITSLSLHAKQTVSPRAQSFVEKARRPVFTTRCSFKDLSLEYVAQTFCKLETYLPNLCGL